jgi:hypothetical protein
VRTILVTILVSGDADAAVETIDDLLVRLLNGKTKGAEL